MGVNDLIRLRKEQIHSNLLNIWNDRGVQSFEVFNPNRILRGDNWRSNDLNGITVNLVEGNVKVYKGDLIIALVDNPGPLTYPNINLGKWQIMRKTPYGEGPKQTGVDGGYIHEGAISNDFIFICVTPGDPEPFGYPGQGTAVWKRIQLHST